MRPFSFLSMASLLFAFGCEPPLTAWIDLPITQSCPQSPSQPGTVKLYINNCSIQNGADSVFDFSGSSAISFIGNKLTNKSTTSPSGLCFTSKPFDTAIQTFKCNVFQNENPDLAKLANSELLYARTTNVFFLPNIINNDVLLTSHASATLSDGSQLASVGSTQLLNGVGAAASAARSPIMATQYAIIQKPSLLMGDPAEIFFQFQVSCALKAEVPTNYLQNIIPQWQISSIEISNNPAF